MKRLIGFVAVLIICVSAHYLVESSDNLSAENSHSGSCGENVTYEFDDAGGTLTISGYGPMYEYHEVRTVPWYSFRESINAVIIQDSVSSIGNMAFDGCSSLNSVSIPDSVTLIGDMAFDGCSSLYSITIPDSVTSIGIGAFDSCSSLRNITLSNNLSSISSGTFDGCTSLESIIIPESVTSIGFGSFHTCTSLKSIILPESVTTVKDSVFKDCISLNSITIPDHVTSLGNSVFMGCISLTSVNLGASVTDMGISVFDNCPSLITINVSEDNQTYCSIDGVLFKNNVTSLVQYPAGKTDTTYTIPDSVTNVEECAFLNCASLISVSFPESLLVIAIYAFDSCTSLTSISLPNSLVAICNMAFNCCTGLKSVDLGNSVEIIGDSAFSGCTSLTSITIPSTVNYFGKAVLSTCSSLTSITVDEGNEFYCSIDGVLFDIDKTTLMQYPAKKSNISYMIPETVTTINAGSFMGCTDLVTVTIPSSVTSIGLSAFQGCNHLFEVINLSSLTDVCNGKYGLENVNNFFTSSSEATVKTDEHGFVFGKSEGVYYLICYIGNESEITIPLNFENSEYVIRNNAFAEPFYDCDGVTEIEQTAANLAGLTFKKIDDKWVKQNTSPAETNSGDGLWIYLILAIVATIIIVLAVVITRAKFH